MHMSKPNIHVCVRCPNFASQYTKSETPQPVTNNPQQRKHWYTLICRFLSREASTSVLVPRHPERGGTRFAYLVFPSRMTSVPAGKPCLVPAGRSIVDFPPSRSLGRLSAGLSLVYSFDGQEDFHGCCFSSLELGWGMLNGYNYLAVP